MNAPSDPRPPEQDPAAVERRRIPAAHFLRVRGRGRAEIQLKGTGQLTMIRGRYDDFCFEGRGLPRHLSATCVHLRAAEGRVILEGEDLELEFFGGLCEALLVGTFEVEARGPGGSAPPPGRAQGGSTGRPTLQARDNRSSDGKRRV